jgi:hypothetical protein
MTASNALVPSRPCAATIQRFSALQEKHLHRYLAEFDFRFSTRTAFG